MRYLAALFLLSLPLHAQVMQQGVIATPAAVVGPLWTLIQHPNDGFTCSSYSCSLTNVTTTAGDLLILTSIMASTTASAPTSASGDSTWTHCPASFSQANVTTYFLQADCYYIPVAAGVTNGTFTMNWSTGGAFIGAGISLTEARRASGSATYDVGDQRQDFSCTACVGPTITTTGASDFVLVWTGASGTSTGPGGTWNAPTFDGAVAGQANFATGSSTATWNFASAAVAAMATVAFK